MSNSVFGPIQPEILAYVTEKSRIHSSHAMLDTMSSINSKKGDFSLFELRKKFALNLYQACCTKSSNLREEKLRKNAKKALTKVFDAQSVIFHNKMLKLLIRQTLVKTKFQATLAAAQHK